MAEECARLLGLLSEGELRQVAIFKMEGYTNEEIARHILIAADLGPVFSGAMRRVPIPGTELARLGIVSELRMAQIVAVTRLATPRTVTGNCTHEPNVLGAAAGANLLWAETGANPRDTRQRTEEGRGFGVDRCRDILAEAEWHVHEASSSLCDIADRVAAGRVP